MIHPTRPILEHRRISSACRDTPSVFRSAKAPHELLARPFMDMDTGDSFEHTELAEHPNAMENIQLRTARENYEAARARGLTPFEALAALQKDVECSILCRGMAQPVRAPDNMLYEGNALVASMQHWRTASPMTRMPFPRDMRLAVDRRMQELSAMTGTPISEKQRQMLHLHVSLPALNRSLEDMEEGRMEATLPPPWWCTPQVLRGGLAVVQGTVVGALIHGMDMPWIASCAGAVLFGAATMVLPTGDWRRMPLQIETL